jgi:hypothetical protein
MIEKLTEKLHAKKVTKLNSKSKFYKYLIFQRDSMKQSHTKETHQEIQPPPITPRISSETNLIIQNF